MNLKLSLLYLCYDAVISYVIFKWQIVMILFIYSLTLWYQMCTKQQEFGQDKWLNLKGSYTKHVKQRRQASAALREKGGDPSYEKMTLCPHTSMLECYL